MTKRSYRMFITVSTKASHSTVSLITCTCLHRHVVPARCILIGSLPYHSVSCCPVGGGTQFGNQRTEVALVCGLSTRLIGLHMWWFIIRSVMKQVWHRWWAIHRDFRKTSFTVALLPDFTSYSVVCVFCRFIDASLTSWNRALIEKPIVAQPVKKFRAFCKTWRFSTMFRRSCE
jgi:hypothetical protein